MRLVARRANAVSVSLMILVAPYARFRRRSFLMRGVAASADGVRLRCPAGQDVALLLVAIGALDLIGTEPMEPMAGGAALVSAGHGRQGGGLRRLLLVATVAHADQIAAQVVRLVASRATRMVRISLLHSLPVQLGVAATAVLARGPLRRAGTMRIVAQPTGSHVAVYHLLSQRRRGLGHYAGPTGTRVLGVRMAALAVRGWRDFAGGGRGQKVVTRSAGNTGHLRAEDLHVRVAAHARAGVWSHHAHAPTVTLGALQVGLAEHVHLVATCLGQRTQTFGTGGVTVATMTAVGRSVAAGRVLARQQARRIRLCDARQAGIVAGAAGHAAMGVFPQVSVVRSVTPEAHHRLMAHDPAPAEGQQDCHQQSRGDPYESASQPPVSGTSAAARGLRVLRHRNLPLIPG
jgi:hypothetical protein